MWAASAVKEGVRRGKQTLLLARHMAKRWQMSRNVLRHSPSFSHDFYTVVYTSVKVGRTKNKTPPPPFFFNAQGTLH